jgi:Holliday junction resolvase RusA-like endonuclease
VIVLIVPGEPCGKGRPRFTRKGFAYTPTKTRNYEATVKAIFAQTYPNFVPLDGALKVTVFAYMGIPASVSVKKRDAMLAQEIWPTKRPDIDNIFKIIDALNGIAFRDDSLIVSAVIRKAYSERPRLEIFIIPKGGLGLPYSGRSSECPVVGPGPSQIKEKEKA